MQYNSESNLDKLNMSSDIALNLDNDITLKLSLNMSKGDFESSESCNIRISSSEEKFGIFIDSVYADNEDYAIDVALNISNRICTVLTYIVQSQNPNFNYFHPKFTYRIRDIQCKEDIYQKYQNAIKKSNENGNTILVLSERFKITEALQNKMIYKVKSDSFVPLYNLSLSNNHLSFAIESYYRALGDIEFISKYYNLFTIIEYVEVNFRQYTGAVLMFNNRQKADMMDILLEKVNEYLKNKVYEKEEYIDRFKCRISQLISDVTDKTRAEKLVSIIKDYFGILNIEESIIKYDISESKIKEFIDTRNSLFHAKKLNQDDINKLTILTNELMVLCKCIIGKLIEKAEKN